MQVSLAHVSPGWNIDSNNGHRRRRRVKCDEARPECRRCIDTRIQCDGYGTPSEASNSPKPRQHGFKIVMDPRSAGHTDFTRVMCNGDDRCISFFRAETLPLVSRHFNPTFWAKVAGEISAAPALRDCAVALSFQHASLGSERSGLQDGRIAIAAERAYGRSLESARQLFSAKDRSAGDALHACLMLCLVECCRRDSVALRAHLKAGLGLFAQEGWNNIYCRHAFAAIATSTLIYCPDSALLDALRVSPVGPKVALTAKSPAETFCNYIDDLAADVYNFADGILLDRFTSPTAEASAQVRLLSQLADVEQLLEASVRNTSDSLHQSLRRSHLARLMIVRALVETAPQRSQEAYDSRLDRFRTALDHCTAFIEDDDWTSYPFVVGVGVVSTLRFIASLCRHPQLRRQATALLDKAPRRDGIWDASECKRLAEMAIDIEEEGLIPIPNAAEHFGVPEKHRIFFSCTVESAGETNNKKSVLIFTKPDGPQGAVSRSSVSI